MIVHRPDNRRRAQRGLLAVGALLLVLGIGNITFGGFKAAEYGALLERATADRPKTEEPTELRPFRLTGETDRRALYVAKLRNRVDFYEIAVLGGKWIVAFGLLFIVGAAWLARLNGGVEAEEEPPRPL